MEANKVLEQVNEKATVTLSATDYFKLVNQAASNKAFQEDAEAMSIVGIIPADKTWNKKEDLRWCPNIVPCNAYSLSRQIMLNIIQDPEVFKVAMAQGYVGIDWDTRSFITYVYSSDSSRTSFEKFPEWNKAVKEYDDAQAKAVPVTAEVEDEQKTE